MKEYYDPVNQSTLDFDNKESIIIFLGFQRYIIIA